MGIKSNYEAQIVILPDIISISFHLVLPHYGQIPGKISKKCAYYENSKKMSLLDKFLLDAIFVIVMV